MKLAILGLSASVLTVSAIAQTAIVGTPVVTKSGTQITLQFPVTVTIDGTTYTSTIGTGAPTTGSGPAAGNPGIANPAGTGIVSALAVTTGLNGAFNGFKPLAISDLYKDISTAAVDPFTTEFMSIYGPNHLKADFTIPYNVVNGATKNVMSKVNAADESDVMPVPINASTIVENGIQGCKEDGADHHALVVDSATGFDYEIYNATYCNGKWSAYSVTLWDLTKEQKRPVGWTSSDAAGLPVLPLLVRYDEVAAGSIDHALRITMNHTKTGPKGSIFVAPATHGAGDVWGTAAYMGMRLRLKANYDSSKFSAQNKVIIAAMKKYGMIVADNGSSGFFQGTADSRWNQDDLQKLRDIPLSAFEVVSMGPQATADTAAKGVVPTIVTLTGTRSGANAVLMWNTVNDSYNYIAEVGPVRGTSVTVPYTPGATYTLVSSNQYGRTTKVVKIP